MMASPKKKTGSKKKKELKQTKADSAAPAKTEGSSPPQEEKTRKQTLGKRTRREEDCFIVVGIGASAGGLEAIQAFFSGLPDSCPSMAFVVVSHLDPKHSSILPELIQKHTAMAVKQIEDNMKIEPNRVFVIPPNKDLEVTGSKFNLKPISADSSPRAPINTFFRSLAETRGATAVGIIFSGMGSDGAIGIQAIKGELGMVMVQDPFEAKYTPMPQSVISTGLADFVLPVAEMPKVLADYAQRLLEGEGSTPYDLPEESLKKVLAILRTRTGNDFSHYKKSTLQRRIARRMNIHGILDLAGYVDYLRTNYEENEALVKELLIGVTHFFRDKAAFEALREKALPDLLGGKPEGYTLRVWVAGCSSGEEAYSLAIILLEYIEKHQLGIHLQIFATDLDEDSVEKARAGFYPGDICKDVSTERLKKFFRKDNDSFRIAPKVRETIVFAKQSIIKDPPFTRLDLISCRNLLIYLENSIQKKLLPLFHHSLKQDGLLFLGSSETVGGFSELFATVDGRWKIFRKKSGPLTSYPALDFPLCAPEYRMPKAETKKEINLAQLAERTLLDDYTPVAVIMDRSGNIRYIHGQIGLYFEIPQGTVRNYNAIEMAREGLKIFLLAALRNMNEDAEPERRKVRIGAPDQTFEALVTLRPLTSGASSGLYMALFEDVPLDEKKKSVPEEAINGEENHQRVKELEDELAATRERLRAMMEEVETSNEELRSANEEYQSTNEEFQSTNEELNSSKEELQSLNEELETVNSELQAKVQQVEKAYREMETILNSLGVPVIFLDRNLRIRRFSACAGKIVELIDSDVGRPLSQLAVKTKGINLEKEAQRVLSTGKVIEKSIKAGKNRSYFMRILPYEGAESMENGVVFFFLDTQRLTEVIEQLRLSEDARQLAEGIIETVRQPLLVLDHDFTILKANKCFLRTFRLIEHEVEGESLFNLSDGQWDIPDLRRLLEEVLPNSSTFDDFTVEGEFAKVGRKKMILNGRRIQEHGMDMERILLAMEVLSGKAEEAGKR